MFKKCCFIFIFVVQYQLSFSEKMETNMEVINIHEHWQFKKASQKNWMEAEVPGCIHTDLIKNKIIKGPFYRTVEKEIQWIGEEDWEYQTTFDVPDKILKKENVEIIFKGIDTYADIYLNGNLLISTYNMFREWRVNVKDILKAKGNALHIYFHNVFKVDLPKWENAPFRLSAFPNNDQSDIQIAMYARKAQFHYGWDWGPRLITCGIWRPVQLIAWNDFIIRDIFIRQDSVSKECAQLTAVVEAEAAEEVSAQLWFYQGEVEIDEQSVQLITGMNKFEIPIEVENPRLWWTNGLGEQYLYKFSVELQNGKHHKAQSVKTGLRDLKIIREKDDQGTSFYVQLNGIPVFMKGANYIPQDNFQNRVTPERYEYLIRSAAESNMNMLRVWGGGIYENDIFYELCDRYGILIWQDMMFACAMYPGDENFLENVEQEVSQNVKRLRNHPCIALYCGNNENEISWYQWNWKQQYPSEIQEKYESDLHRLFYQIIPDAIQKVDPKRYYHPTSPNTGYNSIPISEGDVHYWGVWHGHEPFSSYRDNIGRFMSEYGFQSYPDISSIEKFTLPEDRYVKSPVLLAHQKCYADKRRNKEYAERIIQNYMKLYYGFIPEDFEDYVYLTQILQVLGITMAIESHRANKLSCMGTMYWQLNDCWPVISWSSIDYYGRWKPLHYRIKDRYKNIIVTGKVESNNLVLNVISDGLDGKKVGLMVNISDFRGQKLCSFSKEMEINPDKPVTMNLENLIMEDLVKIKNRVFILINLIDEDKNVIEQKILFIDDLKNLKLEIPNIDIKVKREGKNFFIKLNSDIFVRDLVLYSNADGHFSDNCINLLPSEKKTIVFYPSKRINNDDLEVKIKSLNGLYSLYK